MDRTNNKRRRRVAMLVHNSVMRDARVLKEARSLSQDGFDVEIHGFDPDADGQVQLVPGTDVKVFLHSIGNLARKSRGGSAESQWATRVGAKLPSIFRRALGIVARSFNDARRFIRWTVRVGAAFAGAPGQKWVVSRRFNQIGGTLAAGVKSRPAPDVIHLHDIIALTAARDLRKQYPDAKIVWDAHEIYEDLAQAQPFLGKLNASIIREASGTLDRFITISDSFAQFYKENYPGLPTDSVIIRNATEVMPVCEDDGRLRQAAGLPAGQKIVLYQGGFATRRGLEDLVAASAYLDPGWSIVMMGWGALEGQLHDIYARSQENGVSRDVPAVSFIPGAPQAELPMWTAGATIGVIPYEDYGLNHKYCTPNKLWEYPNARVPILASDLVEIRKVIDGWNVGWCLPKNPTPKDIANTINSLNDIEIARARVACGKFVEADNWAVYEKRLLRLYGSFSGTRQQGTAEADSDEAGDFDHGNLRVIA